MANFEGATDYMPQRSPRGWGMTRRADQFFMQQQLRELNFDEPAFEQCPPLLGAQPESPECEQFDSAREDIEEEGGATSGLDAKLGASMGEETEVSGHPDRAPSAERHRRRNRVMRREHARA